MLTLTSRFAELRRPLKLSEKMVLFSSVGPRKHATQRIPHPANPSGHHPILGFCRLRDFRDRNYLIITKSVSPQDSNLL